MGYMYIEFNILVFALNFIVIISCTCTLLLRVHFLSITLHHKSSGTPCIQWRKEYKEEEVW